MAICFPRTDIEFLWKTVAKILDIFFRPREANFLPKFRRTREETRAEQTASRDILLSSFLTCGGLYTNTLAIFKWLLDLYFINPQLSY